MKEKNTKTSEQISLLLDYYGLNANAFATKFGLPSKNISNAASGRNAPSLETIEMISKATGASKEWLLEGKGAMFKTDAEKLIDESFPASIIPFSEMEHISLPMLDAKAIASFEGNIYGNMRELTTGRHFLVAKIPGEDYDNAYALKINGNSMLPRYTDGTIVLVRLVPPGKWQYATGDHAVSLKNEMFTVKKIVKNNNNLMTLKATNPHNPEELTVQIADILCMFKVGQIVHSPAE